MADRYPPALRELLEGDEDARLIGPFKLQRQLGRGGFAPVWLANEVYGAKELRPAAVKLFALDARLAGHRDAVIEEARALCRVEHPNIVRFYSLPIDEARGIMGVAMEYVAGTPLDVRLRDEGTLSLGETITVGLSVAKALAAVHAAGLVHRDVKPANVVESRGIYKLIDFGIASAEAQPQEPTKRVRNVVLDDLPIEVVGTKMSMLASAYTVDGPRDASVVPFSATGTIGYIDPVCVQTGASATAASDLYGLGAMLYECLVGQIPAIASAAAGTGLRGEVLDGRAPARKLREIDDAIPTALADLVESLLEPAREARPASADSVVETLERLRASMDRPAATGETTPTQLSGGTRAGARSSGRRVAFAAAAVVALVALAGALWMRGSHGPAAAPTPPPTTVAAHPCGLGDLADCTAACDANDYAGCQTLAAMYQTNTGVPKDLTRAQELYAKACGGGNFLACYKLGAMLEAALDYAGALVRYRQGCDGGEPESCNAAGALLWAGRGAPQDAAGAVALFERACASHYYGACASLAVAYDRGVGVPADPARAATIYEEACEHGALTACADLGSMCVTGRGTAADPARAAALYKRACDGDTPRACQGLGVLYQEGLGVPKDPKRAAALYASACEKNEWAACAALGKLETEGDPLVRDPAGALAAFQRGCDASEPEACKGLADFYAAGTYVVKNAAKARELYRQACDAGADDACRTGATAPTPLPVPAPKAALPLPRPKPACNCQPGDPLCACL